METYGLESEMSKRHRIGNNIRAIRNMKGISQKALAETAGIGLRTLSNIEACRTCNPGFMQISNIAEALNCGMDDLIYREDPEMIPERDTLIQVEPQALLKTLLEFQGQVGQMIRNIKKLERGSL
ncbi:MAG: helix-turn-helix domain-containing protein [Lachnospiraceae bacterium]|nr:helix-turn-helix domain-containing protein [Lachnospiraceae bacterium]